MRRRRLHGQVGEVLAASPSPSPDPDAVAYHLQQAGDKRAVAWLERAAARAADSAAPMAAANRYAAAFALLDTWQGAAGERGWFRLLAASLCHYQDPDPANHLVEEALHLAGEAGDASLAARALAMRGLLRTYRGEVCEGIEDLTAAADAIDDLPSTAEPDRGREERIDQIANRGTRIAFLGYAGRLAEARMEGERLLAMQTSTTIPGGVGVLGDIHSGLSITYALLGEPTLAMQSYAGAVAAYQTVGHQVLAVMNQREELVCVVLPYRADDLAIRERAAAAVEATTRRLVGAGTYAAMDPQYTRLPLLILEGHWREARHVADVGAWSVYQPSHHLNVVVGQLARAQGDREHA